MQMQQRARIKLSSTDIDKLNQVCNQIKEIAEKTGADIRGPIPLPTKILKVTTRRTPCGGGSETYDRFEMRIHKRIIDLSLNERALRAIMRIPALEDLNIEIKFT